ncbi:MAG: DUF262 domain-containing protein [Candidatus Binataceae bacterium]|nr:DUF262 domain-containing protein [Candidatus Binataceae bacterium]
MAVLIPTQLSVSELMDDFFRGRIAIPEIQRDVVWDSDQVKELFDSIYQTYPCGSLIFWEPRLRDGKLMREIIRPEMLAYFKNRLPKYFLIDGQQRVTALASVMLEPGFLKRIEPEIENSLSSLYADLRHIPKEIEAANDGEGYKFPWALLNDVFDGRVKDVPDFNKLSQDTKRKVDRYVQQIRNYKFPVQIIQETDYPTVGKIFSRVNSQGTQLTGAEIYIASIIPHWRGISTEFRKYRGDLRKDGYDLDLTFLMRAITTTACDVPQIKKLADKVSHGDLKRSQLDRLWRESKRAINLVKQCLREGLFLDKTKFILSKNALVPLVYYVAKSRGKRLDRKAMMKYFLVSQLGGHYGAGGETVLRRDLKYLSEPGTRPTDGLRELLAVAIAEAKQEYRGLRISHNQITGITSKNVILLLMYIAMRKKRAEDFGLSEPQGLENISSDELQLHHIFPFDFMMKDNKARQYQEDRALTPRKYREQVNDIANITFLSQKTNVQIGNVSPWQYLGNETSKESRRAHFIPEERELWKPENFDKFLDRRRRMLAKAINSLVRSLR